MLIASARVPSLVTVCFSVSVKNQMQYEVAGEELPDDPFQRGPQARGSGMPSLPNEPMCRPKGKLSEIKRKLRQLSSRRKEEEMRTTCEEEWRMMFLCVEAQQERKAIVSIETDPSTQERPSFGPAWTRKDGFPHCARVTGGHPFRASSGKKQRSTAGPNEWTDPPSLVPEARVPPGCSMMNPNHRTVGLRATGGRGGSLPYPSRGLPFET